jgi:long-chain acyl-CoA synthetase
MPATVGSLIADAASRFGEKTALIFEDEPWSFRDIDRASSQVARQLQVLGVAEGATVSLYSQNCPEWVIAYYGVLKMGGVVNPLNLMLTPQEAVFAMADCGAVAVIGSAEKLDALAPMLASTAVRHAIAYRGLPPAGALAFDEILEKPEIFAEPRTEPFSTCTVGYTSGTTGHPKGAVLTHHGILMNVAMTATMHGRTAADTVVSALPCSHVYGNIVMNAAVAYGMTLVLHASFDVERVLRSIQKHRATMFEGVPTMYMYMLSAPQLRDYDVSSLTRCTVGGQTMPEVKMRQVQEAFGCPLIELWGMTELGGLGTTHSLYGPSRLGSIGVALPHLQARIAAPEDNSRTLAPGQVGELQVRGPMVMREYLGHPEATAQTLDGEGWLHTGDLAHMDADGYIYLVDRLKDMIITAGFNIYPAELERVIAEHADVAMVAVGSVSDDNKGELAKAYIVLRKGASPDAADIERHCRERLAAYKIPRAFQFVTDLPKTSSGKILRRKLRELGTGTP